MFLQDSDYSILTVNSWLVERWTDEYLQWDARDYQKVDSMDVPSTDIWKPDFSLYNSDLAYGIGECHDTNCLLNSTGRIVCISPCSHTGHCRADYARWPYDTQNCSFSFGTWMNTGEEVNYNPEKVKVRSLAVAQHGQWKMLSSSVQKLSSSYKVQNGTTSTYPSLKFSFVLERHSASLACVIVVPAIIMLWMNLIILWISPELIERIFLVIFNIFSHFMFTRQLSWFCPHNGDNPPSVCKFSGC